MSGFVIVLAQRAASVANSFSMGADGECRRASTSSLREVCPGRRLVAEDVEGCTEDNQQCIFMETKNVGWFYISNYTSSESKLIFHNNSKKKKWQQGVVTQEPTTFIGVGKSTQFSFGILRTIVPRPSGIPTFVNAQVPLMKWSGVLSTISPQYPWMQNTQMWRVTVF